MKSQKKKSKQLKTF